MRLLQAIDFEIYIKIFSSNNYTYVVNITVHVVV